MICQRCLFRGSALRALTKTTPSASASASTTTPTNSRLLSTTSPLSAQAISPNAAQTSQPHHAQAQPKPATSTPSASQPFTAGKTPTADGQLVTTGATESGNPAVSPSAGNVPPIIRSSVPAGTVLKGLNYYKNKSDPVALEDHEYPSWLWHVLDEKPKSAAEGLKQEVDPRLFSKSARARQKANKLARLQAKRNPPPSERPLPIYEQTIDLGADQESRMQLTKAMRSKRRRDIKEGNFLKSMS